MWCPLAHFDLIHDLASRRPAITHKPWAARLESHIVPLPDCETFAKAFDLSFITVSRK